MVCARDIFSNNGNWWGSRKVMAAAIFEKSMDAWTEINLMFVLIKTQRSMHIYLFRKVLREARTTVFGRQECVVGKNYTSILCHLFIRVMTGSKI